MNQTGATLPPPTVAPAASPYQQVGSAAEHVRSEPENVRFLEWLIAVAPSSQVAVRGWRVLIGIELSLLSPWIGKELKDSKDGVTLKRTPVSKTDFESWEKDLLACTIGYVQPQVESLSNGFFYSISVKESRGADSSKDQRLSDVLVQVLPEASPGLETGERVARENIAAAMECRFISLHQKLRRKLFDVGIIGMEFGHEDPAARRASQEVRTRRHSE